MNPASPNEAPPPAPARPAMAPVRPASDDPRGGTMATLTIEVPDAVLQGHAGSLDAATREARLLLAARWFELGRITGGTAAALAGMSRAAFMREASKLGISPIQVAPEHLDRELAGV